MKNIKMIFDIANFVNCDLFGKEQVNMSMSVIEAVHIRDICKKNIFRYGIATILRNINYV